MINKENVLKAIKADTNSETTINACNFVLTRLSSEISFDDYASELNDILIDNSDELCKLYGTTNEEDLENLGNYIESFIVEELEKPYYEITRFEIDVNKRLTKDELIKEFKKKDYEGTIIANFFDKEQALI